MKIFRWMTLIVLTLLLGSTVLPVSAAPSPARAAEETPVAPAVVSSLRANPDPTSASLVNFTVTFSEAVAGVDIADFNLTRTGALTGGVVTGVTGTGAVYTVSASTGSGSGTLRLNVVSGATISTVSAGSPLTGLPYTGGESYTVSGQGFSVVSSLRAGPNPTSAASINFTVTFSEAVVGVDIADFNLTRTGALSGGAVTGVTGSGAVYTVSASTGTGSGTLRLNLVSTASITSVLGGSLLTALPYTSGETYTVRAPAVSSIVRANPNPTTAASVNFTVTFSESVTGVGTADFAITKTNTLTGAAVTAVTGGPTIYTVSVNTGSGSGTLRLDVASNAVIAGTLSGTALSGLPYTAGEIYSVRPPSGPTVVSSVRASLNPTTAASVNFTVTFSEAVTGVGNADFSLTQTGAVSGASITGVGGGPTVYTVSVNTGSGSGTLRLDLPVEAAVTSTLTGVPLTGLPFITGESYTVDKTPPSLISLRSVAPAPTIEMDIAVTNLNPGASGAEVYLSYDPALVAPASPAAEALPGFFGASEINTAYINEVLPAASCPGGLKPCVHLALLGTPQTTKAGAAARFHFTSLATGSACFSILQSGLVNTSGYPVTHDNGPEQCIPVQFGHTVSGLVQRQGLPANPNPGAGSLACTSITTTGVGVLPAVKTNIGGGFTFINPPAGTYTFHAAYSGYLTINTSVTVPVEPSVIALDTITLLGGDVDSNGVINILDIMKIITKFGSAGSAVGVGSAVDCSAADEIVDINDDGLVNISDLAIVAGNFGLVEIP